MKTELLTKNDLLVYWQSQRKLTRKTIEAFPENDLLKYTIGGMRTFADMAAELIALSVPALMSFATNNIQPFDEIPKFSSKEQLLKQWDDDTTKIDQLFAKLTEQRMQENFILFKIADYKIIQHIFYFIDNEIHHRGQAYVYLRAIGIQPPNFFDGF